MQEGEAGCVLQPTGTPCIEMKWMSQLLSQWLSHFHLSSNHQTKWELHVSLSSSRSQARLHVDPVTLHN